MTKNFDSATWGRLATVNTTQRDTIGEQCAKKAGLRHLNA